MRRVQSFDDVEHEQPVTINAYHGTTPYNAEQIKQQGFKFGPEVERNGFTPEFEKRLGRKHLLGNGIYFADEQRKKHYGQYGGGSLHKVEVTLQKPYVVHHGSWAELKKLDPDGLKAQGYDGIIVKQGKYGLRAGENYRQGVAFHPHSIKIVDAHEPVRELLPHAKVRHAVTGEKGVVRRVTKVSDAHREWMKQNKPEAEQPPANWVSVKWNGSKRLGTKSRVDHNVHDHHLVVAESVADRLIGMRLRESALARSRALVENRLPALHKKWSGTLNTSHDGNLMSAVSRDTMDSTPETADREKFRSGLAFKHIAKEADPTPNNQYTDRALHWYHKGQYRLEDAPRVKSALSVFHANKHKLPEKDINKYGSIHDLERAVEPHREQRDMTPWTKTTEKQRQAVESGSRVIHDGPDLTVRHVQTHDAMKVLGSNTSWCVVPDKGTFDDYAGRGNLYHVHEKKTGARRLLHFQSGQFMDEHDAPEDHGEYAKKHPEMVKALHGRHYEMFSDKAKLDKEIIGGLHDDTDIGHQAAEHSTNPKVLHALHKSDYMPERDDYDDPWADEDLKTTAERVADNKHTSAVTLRSLAKSTSHGIRASVAVHKNTSPETLDYLARRGGSDVHPYVAANKNTSEKTIRHLHATGDQVVYRELARNPSTPTDLLSKMASSVQSAGSYNDHDRETQARLSRNPRTPAAALHTLFDKSPHTHQHELLVLHPNADASLLSKAWGATVHRITKGSSNIDNESNLAAAIAAHPNTDADTLHGVASYTNVRHGVPAIVASHPNTSHETLKHIELHAWQPDTVSQQTLAKVKAHPNWKGERDA